MLPVCVPTVNQSNFPFLPELELTSAAKANSGNASTRLTAQTYLLNLYFMFISSSNFSQGGRAPVPCFTFLERQSPPPDTSKSASHYATPGRACQFTLGV